MSPTMQIWQDKIILRLPEDVHPALAPFARYNQKVHGYLLAFSKQNLQRIFKIYPSIDIKNYDRIEDLKRKQQELIDIKEKVKFIKVSTEMPVIDLKMPPLGDYQRRGVWFLLENKKSALFADCGVGKTFMTLVSTEMQMKAGLIERGKVLVCGKLATLETGWMEDTKKFTDLTAQLLWLPATSKRKEKLTRLLNYDADLYIINHEGVLVLEEELCAKNFQKVIIDESTILKSYHGDFTRDGGKFGKAIMNVAKNSKWKVIMSGTPAPNGPEDLWGQFKFLDPEGLLLEASYNDFKAAYMDEIVFGRNRMDAPKKYVFKKEYLPFIGDLVNSIAYQVKIRDHLHDLPAKTVISRKVPMSKEQHEHYLKMRDNLSTVLNDEFVAVDVKLAQLVKLRQITGGFLIDQKEEAHEIKGSTKLDAMDSLMEEIGNEKVVVYAQYRWEIKTLAERYKNRGVVTVYGDNKSEDNLSNIKKFIQDPNTKVIILHPKSAAHGVTFTVAHYMIFYSVSYSAEDDYQCVARIERAGQKHPIFVYYLLSKFDSNSDEHKETIDEVIYRALRIKGKNQDHLLSQSEIDMEIILRGAL